jgi:hypothetical protein
MLGINGKDRKNVLQKIKKKTFLKTPAARDSALEGEERKKRAEEKKKRMGPFRAAWVKWGSIAWFVLLVG